MTQTSAHPDTEISAEVYDFVFIGMGAGNSLILLSLLKNNAILNKKVAVLEATQKNINDKTYCFWAHPDESIATELAPIISHRYTSIQVNESKLQHIDTQPYHYIRSIDLYNYTFDAIRQANIRVFNLAANAITNNEEIYTIQTPSLQVQSRHIFDSRPPSIELVKDKDIYLHQSFYGYHVKIDQQVFNEHAFEMMNFNVDQGDYTQFVYVLPFSSDEALIELTRFGSEKIELTYAKDILHKFIHEKFGNYVVIGDETGCIPMTTFINKPNKQKGILNTGAAANLIKPSTGYGFKNMFVTAKHISEQIKCETKVPFNQIALKRKGRFKFYDHLLLLILLRWPHQGKKIFGSLFNRQSILTIFSFLDEKTSIFDEVKIFSTLPIITFLKALFIYLKDQKWLRYLFAAGIAILYWIIASFNMDIAVYISYFLLAGGFLVLGIPHGALDHLVVRNNNDSLYHFIIKYLVIVVLYYVAWQFFPLLSLIIFVIYSSFHFGESELQELGVSVSKAGKYLHAFTLGLGVLLFIITTHIEESIAIITKFNIVGTELLNIGLLNNYAASAAVVVFGYLFLLGLQSKKMGYWGLIFLLLVGIKLPLILAFAFYFILQHSFNAWNHLKTGLKMNAGTLYKQALPYTMGAFAILLAMLLYANTNLNIEFIWAQLFIFIACISLPHFVLMHVFYRTTGV
jgi:lycopene beta-cyclase